MHADTDPALAAWRDIHAQIGEVISHSAQVELQMRMLFETLINGTGPVWEVSSRLTIESLTTTCGAMIKRVLPAADPRLPRWDQIKKTSPRLAATRAAIVHSAWHFTQPDENTWRGVAMPAKGPGHEHKTYSLQELKDITIAAGSLAAMISVLASWIDQPTLFQNWTPTRESPWVQMSQNLVTAWPALASVDAFSELPA